MPRIRRCPEQNPASSGPPWCTWRRVMKTESTLYFDGQFWVGVIERHEADRVRAVRIVFGAQPSDAEFYEFLLAHANALLCRLDEAAWTPDIAQRQTTHHNPKRAQRQASRLARRALPSTASQASVQAERERTAQERAPTTRQEKREKSEEKRRLARLKARARHRGH